MHTHQFWWMCLLWFRRYCYLQKRPVFPFGPWNIVHGGQIIELAQNFMQVEVDMIRMQTNFVGHGLSGFVDFGPFQV